MLHRSCMGCSSTRRCLQHKICTNVKCRLCIYIIQVSECFIRLLLVELDMDGVDVVVQIFRCLNIFQTILTDFYFPLSQIDCHDLTQRRTKIKLV